MDIPTAQKVFNEYGNEMQKVESKEEFKAFWEHLKAEGYRHRAYTGSDPPVAWIEDKEGVVIAKWYHEFGPDCPHEFRVEKAQWMKWKESQ